MRGKATPQQPIPQRRWFLSRQPRPIQRRVLQSPCKSARRLRSRLDHDVDDHQVCAGVHDDSGRPYLDNQVSGSTTLVGDGTPKTEVCVATSSSTRREL